MNPQICNNQCPQKIEWQSQYPGCYSSSFNSPNYNCSINYPGDRYYIADYRPLVYERGLLIGSEPNFYKNFVQRRQNYLQFITNDWPVKKTNYLKPIKSIQDSYCYKNNMPQYIHF
jgi:hypothetical protein